MKRIIIEIDDLGIVVRYEDIDNLIQALGMLRLAEHPWLRLEQWLE
jgi:hypothetical protein